MVFLSSIFLHELFNYWVIATLCLYPHYVFVPLTSLFFLLYSEKFRYFKNDLLNLCVYMSLCVCIHL